MLLLVFAANDYVRYKSGKFLAQCKLSNSQMFEKLPLNVTLLQKGKEIGDPDATRVFTFNKSDIGTTKENNESKHLLSQILGKNLLEFNVTIDKYPLSLRYRGGNTGSITFGAKADLDIGGVTQTIWGGANTAYMVSRPECQPDYIISNCVDQKANFAFRWLRADKVTDSETGYTTITWNIKDENFAFTAAGEVQQYTLAYVNSGVNKYFSNGKNATPIENWATSGMTPDSVKKYWPVTRKNAEGKLVPGGPKHGELVVFSLLLFMSNRHMDICAGLPILTCLQTLINTRTVVPTIDQENGMPKYKLVSFTLDDEPEKEYYIYNAVGGNVQCVANIFMSYDIYWNAWAVAVCSIMLVIAAVCIIPTKCIDVRKIIQKRKAAVNGQEVAAAPAHANYESLEVARVDNDRSANIDGAAQ